MATLRERFDQLVDGVDAELAGLNEELAEGSAVIADQGAQIAALKSAGSTKKSMGINVHLFSDPVYSDIDKVIASLQYLGIKSIRQDFDTDTSGKMLQHDKWVVYKAKLDAAGIFVRAMFYIRGNDGFATYQGIAKNYPYFTEIEIGNENAIQSLLTGSGLVASDYDSAKLEKNTKYVFDAYRGLLSINRPIKIITSITWIHYYYFDLLRSLGANLWLSVHSYTDGFWNAANQPATKGLTAWQAAKARYGDMVFEIGETNYMPKDLATYTDALQLERGIKMLDETYEKSIPTWWFELYDRGNSSGREKTFGLIRGDGTVKPLGEEIKKRMV